MAIVLAGLFGASIGSAQNNRTDWNKPFPPHKVIGNIYYVGSEQLGSFLTPAQAAPMGKWFW
jgi:hypothetical protein